MWNKIKNWWRKLKWQWRKRDLDIETMLWEELLGCNVVPGTVHVCQGAISSVYFNQDKEWVVVDFSQWEETGIAHFMMITKDDISKYDPNMEQKDHITTYIPDVVIFMRQFEDGSAGWCFRY